MRDKKWVDPRRALKELAEIVAEAKPEDRRQMHTLCSEARALADAVLEFLHDEPVTLVMSQDDGGMTATAHPSPASARREIISNMLDIGGGYFSENAEGHEFLELVAAGKFKAAIDMWNVNAGDALYDTHDGKVEKNYTVAELKERARAVLEDERRLGRYKP